MCYVTPTDDMVIRPGQYVGGDGKVYHPYLAHWREAWEVSQTRSTTTTEREKSSGH